jgi:hypothetical protein
MAPCSALSTALCRGGPARPPRNDFSVAGWCSDIQRCALIEPGERKVDSPRESEGAGRPRSTAVLTIRGDRNARDMVNRTLALAFPSGDRFDSPYRVGWKLPRPAMCFEAGFYRNQTALARSGRIEGEPPLASRIISRWRWGDGAAHPTVRMLASPSSSPFRAGAMRIAPLAFAQE